MRLQVIQNSELEATGVHIPINEWKKLKTIQGFGSFGI